MLRILLSFTVALILSSCVFAQELPQTVRLPWNPEAGENGKPVMVHPNRPDVLRANPFLREYWHLTNHYFYPKNSSGYIYSQGIDVRRFQEQYIDNEERRYKLDDHDKVKYRDMVLNLEMLKLYKTDDPDWWDWTQQYINIARMTKAIGKPVAIYGTHHTGGAEFQVWYNIGRFEYLLDPERNPNYDQRYVAKWEGKLKEYKQKETNLISRLEQIRNRMDDSMDAVVLSCYMAYNVPSLDSYQWHAYKSYLQQCVSAYSLLYPNKPIYVFIQPSFPFSKPEKFMPMPNEVWNATLKEVYENKDVDRIYIFSLLSAEMPESFFDSLTYGPSE